MTTAGEGDEFDHPPADPLVLLRDWLDGALSAGVPDATAVSLATTGTDGTPSVRFVALADINDTGVVFSTTDHSPKVAELQHTPQVALAGHWGRTGQQFRLKGTAAAVGESESDRLFAALPRSARAALTVARQSAPLDSHPGLVRRARDLAGSDRDLPRPAHWRSWQVQAQQVQFWAEDPDDVHRRLSYLRTAQGWSVRQLQP